MPIPAIPILIGRPVTKQVLGSDFKPDSSSDPWQVTLIINLETPSAGRNADVTQQCSAVCGDSSPAP
jgi:hypothetical protein